MAAPDADLQGPDLTAGIRLDVLKDGVPLLGQAAGEAVLLVRRGDEVFAIGPTCTHYGGPLAEGLVTGEQIRCPWHHACFSLRTGEVVAAPALNHLPRWNTEIRAGMVYVRDKEVERDALAARRSVGSNVRNAVIVGAGAAGSAAAEGLRRAGFDGRIIMIDAEAEAPYDRPNLSKDYLAGHAPEEWIPLRPPDFYEQHGIERIVDRVSAFDARRKTVTLAVGNTLQYDALVLATGARPIRLPITGAELPHVHVLRSLRDCRALIDFAQTDKRFVVAGASFIGLEAAASLRARGVDVVVVAPEAVPFERVLGRELGSALQRLHERNGVQFRLGRTLSSISDRNVVLNDGDELPADAVLLGVGVRPDLALALAAGLELDNGVLVNEYLESSVPGVYAVGDIARYPDPRSRAAIRVEHWIVAQRQGHTAAANIVGNGQRFDSVPFFWTRQYDVSVAYVGYAPGWDRVQIDGSPDDGDCAVSYLRNNQLLAHATIGRDIDSLKIELELER